MINIDRRALLQEVLAAVREHHDLGAELLRALGVEASAGTTGYISPARYARAHEIGVSTVRQAIREGRLPCERIGRAVRIPADAKIAPAGSGKVNPGARADRVLGLVAGGRR